MAVDVLHHHNRVVDQDANREDQRKQRHPVEREAPGPGGKQGGGQGQDDGGADDHSFAATQRQAHQQNHRAGGECQFLDQLVGFFSGGLAIVTRDGGFDVGRDHGVGQRGDALAHGARHRHRVFARLLAHADGDGRIGTAWSDDSGIALRRR